MKVNGGIVFVLMKLVIVANTVWAVQQELMVLEDFERGTKQWFVQTKQLEVTDLPIVHLTVTSLTPPEGGKQAGLFLWRRSESGEWGRFVLPLDGAQLSAKKAKSLTFWWVGDGSQVSVSFVLVAERQGIERFFKVELSPPQTWQQVNISWDAFRDETGTPVTVFVRYLKELRIERQGPFQPFFFILDDLAAETEAPTLPTVSVRGVVDFQQEQRTNLLRWGACWDEKAINLLQDPTARKKVAELRLGWARLFLNDMVGKRDFEGSAKLVQTWAFQVQRLNMVPVVTISPLKPEDLPSGAFQQQVAFWVQRLFPSVKIYELFYRPFEPPLQLRPETLAIYFSALYEAIKQISPTIQVGGWGERGAWRERLQALFTRAPKPDFFSLHFFGAYNISISNDELMRAARETISADLPDQVPLNRLDEWLRQLYPPSGVPLQVTECAPIAVRTKDGRPADERVANQLGAAWLAALFVQMAGKGETLVHYKLAGDGWGLIDQFGEPQPIYWAVWICNTYFPTGTNLVTAATNLAPLLILAGKTPTANNVLLVNTSANNADVSLEAIGLEKVRTVRVRILRGKETPSYAEMPPNSIVKVRLPAYGVGVVQFVP
ncbi:MAG: hypothetical protein NZ805_02185 [Armatimonadetes bacterium]|nr:hypothetical protein [Armatimonadota bacterium]MDW8026820.1 carbohydrate binding domain-containing protein [Armatimonadota bacterium]